MMVFFVDWWGRGVKYMVYIATLWEKQVNIL
jgi:hypothetical protein